MNFDKWYDQHWEEEDSECKECGGSTDGSDYCSNNCFEASML
jgi:hypothetical protein